MAVLLHVGIVMVLWGLLYSWGILLTPLSPVPFGTFALALLPVTGALALGVTILIILAEGIQITRSDVTRVAQRVVTRANPIAALYHAMVWSWFRLDRFYTRRLYRAHTRRR